MSGLSGSMAGSAYAMNMSMSNSSTAFLQSASSNTTLQVINKLQFLASKSVRTSTIVLAIFNTVSAFATAVGIFYDCYKRAQRNGPRGQARVNIFTCVKGAETFPFVLCLGITIQGIIFAVSQSKGLDGLFAQGCSLISQFMWPAIFIVPFLQVVFAIELAVRGIRTKPFPPRGKWSVVICLAVFMALILILALVAFFIPSTDFCFASLFWFVAKWAKGGFVLFTLSAAILAGCVATIFIKLTRNSTIETSERVQASRMVYYLTMGIISNIFMVPFFIYLTFNNLGDTDGNTGLTLSMIATVVANVSGLMTCGLHLFFRSNIISTIGPRDKLAEYERQQLKHKIRKPDPSEYEFSAHALQPINTTQPLRRMDSEESLIHYDDKEEEASIESPSKQTVSNLREASSPLRSNAVFHPAPNVRAPQRAQLPPPSSSGNVHNRKPSSSYSLFPSKNAGNTTSVALLPSTTYSPISGANPFEDANEFLQPPPSIKPNGRHRRDSSMMSTATVQIGLRFSNVEDMPPMASTMVRNAERVHDLDCPKEIRASPLATFTAVDDDSCEDEPSSPVTRSNSRRDPVKDARMKTLPPVPHAVAPVNTQLRREEEPLTLSPAVYKPDSPTRSRVPSPKGVGHNIPRQSNTSTRQAPASSPPPPRNRGNSDAAAPEGRGDWI